MNTVSGVLPDGKYVMSAELFFKLDGGMVSRYNYVYDVLDEEHGEEVYVRINIVDGDVVDFSYAIHNGNWYRTPDGSRYSTGHAFIDTDEELLGVTACIPYSWRV